MTVAPAATTAAAGDKVLAVRHIVNDRARFGVLDDGAAGDGNDQIVGRRAVDLVALAVAAVACDEFMTVAVGEQGVDALVDAEDDITASSAVATAR